MALDGSGDRVKVVEGADDSVFGGSGGYARAGRDPEGRKPRARAREERVRVAVVTAGELQDAVASGESASKPDGAHRGLRPGGDQPHELDGGNRVHDLLGELDLSLRRGAERRAFGRRRLDRRDDLRVGVAEDERPPGHDPIEVAAPIGVLEVGPRSAPDEERLLEPDRTHGANRRVDPAGDNRLCAAEARRR